MRGYFIYFSVAIFAAMLVASFPALSVQIDAGNRGQAMIVPIFTSHAGLHTTLTVMTTADDGHLKALKVNFRDPRGDLLESLNVYLEQADIWVAALTRIDSGTTRLAIPDESCTLIGQAGAVQPTDSISLSSEYGFVEIVEMGELSSHDIRDEWGDYDCSSLAAVWNEGSWSTTPNRYFAAPSGNLSATASLVNVQRGTMYSMNATALENFSDVAQHTEPSNEHPDLSDAHDEGTTEDATKSVVCSQGECIEDFWARPVDAVSAALTVRELIGEYVLDPTIGAKSELLVTYPTRRFHENDLVSTRGRIGISAYMVTRAGAGIGNPCTFPADYQCTTTTNLGHTGAVHAVAMYLDPLVMEDTRSSAILGLEHEPVTPYYRPDPAGKLRLGYDHRPFLISNDGTWYRGMPVIGVALQEFVNGSLTDDGGSRIKANYGNAFSLVRKPDLYDPPAGE